ncbi:hypothetical protein ACWF94_40790 [Streptomyces sp. NPDC055078]
MMISRSGVRLAAVLLAGVAFAPSASAAPAPPAPQGDWAHTGDGITSGISGMAVLGQGDHDVEVLVVHDNKRAGERRASRVRLSPGPVVQATELGWEGERLPVDLEALTEVPGHQDEFAALESSGHGFHFRLDGDTVTVLREFTVPDVAPGDNYEGFALVERAGRMTAVWAHRGQDEDPALLHTAELDWEGLAFGPRNTVQVRVPDPREHVRHISDVEISAGGRVIITSASDPGDDGPFTSTVHYIGQVGSGPDGGAELSPRPEPVPLASYPGHKIEALACGHGSSGVLGTDDENAGGAARTTGACRS